MKRYTDTQKKTILAKLEKAPQGKFMDAVKATGVSYATIRTWKIKKTGKKQSTNKSAINKGVVAELFKLRNRFNVLLKRL